MLFSTKPSGIVDQEDDHTRQYIHSLALDEAKRNSRCDGQNIYNENTKWDNYMDEGKFDEGG